MLFLLCRRFNAWLLRMGLKEKKTEEFRERKRQSEDTQMSTESMVAWVKIAREKGRCKLDRDTTLNSWEERKQAAIAHKAKGRRIKRSGSEKVVRRTFSLAKNLRLCTSAHWIFGSIPRNEHRRKREREQNRRSLFLQLSERRLR